MFRKITSLFLAVVMAVSFNSIPAAMAESSAVSDGKVAALLESAAANGLLTGIAGEVKPEDDLTRAQMASILSSAFGAAEQAPLSGFTDVDEGAWYYADMAKAVQMGAFIEDGTTLNPEGTITREEAFLALSRVFKLQAGDTAVLNGLKDKDSISPDALDAAAALLKAGYIAAEDGYLNPKAGTTLAEFLQILNGMVKSYLNREGTYTSVPDGSVMINVPDVTLKDVVVKGDLILGDGVGDGSVTLDSVTVTGRTLVRGGGAHSIRITGTSSLQSIVIARVNGELRVFAEDGTEIGEVFVDGRDDVIIEGDFASVTLAADSVTITAVNAQIGSAQIAGENSRIIVAAGSAINTLTVDGANAAVEVSGTVTDVVVNGGGALISGEGQVDSVEANANNVVVTTPDTFVTAAAGTSGVTAGTRDVPEGTTVNTTPEYDGGAGGDKPVVTSISPAQGPASGGTAVTVKGRYFTDATAVTFGGKAAASYTVVSDTQITAVTPAGAIGPADVTVTAPGGTVTKSSAYSYIPIPSITSIGPSSGPLTGGGTVIITGSGFTGATSVTFGGAAASYTVVSDTSITVVLPAGAAGPADVAITTPGGTKTQAAAFIYSPVPSITSLSPNAGPVSGGTTVTITGSGFIGTDLVTFGGRAAVSYTVNSDASITAVTPLRDAGPADVTVTTAGGTGAKTAAYTYAAAPSITSVSPNAGPAAGGTAVTITGTGFTGATSVTFGGAVAASYTVVSGTQITAVTPAGPAGLAGIEVATAGGTAVKASSYTYIPAPVTASVSPNAGPNAGGTAVTITGTGFTGATSVTFGGTAAVSYTIVSDTQITAVTPAGIAGPTDITVTTAGGTGTKTAGYNYIPVPSIASVSPDAGPNAGGTVVMITGTGFTGATSVTFGGTAAVSYTIVSDTQITAVTPWGDAGPADITVTTAGGTGTKTAAYTYCPAVNVNFTVPSMGPLSGGNVVSIAGTGLGGATVVTFGGVNALSFLVISENEIQATVPAGAAGAVDVAVTTPGGTGTASAAYTYIPAPSIASVSPSSGPASGGTMVNITGTWFAGATAVTFGGIPVSSFTVVSDTSIMAEAPAGTGYADVAVTAIGGTGTASAAFTYIPAPSITSVSPNAGPAAGGNTVTIAGAGFTGATVVTTNGIPVTAFTVVSDTTITAVVRGGFPGLADVAVTANGGTGVKTGGYTYVPLPGINFMDPVVVSTAGGTEVTITGVNLSTATGVTFGSSPAASFTVDSDTQIRATTPAGSFGPTDVKVTTIGGTSMPLPILYFPPPVITSVTPDRGPAEGGGAPVIITGSGFLGVTSVTFGSVPAVSFTFNSDTQITAVAPAGTAGPADVAVTTNVCTGTASGAYTYLPAPTIASVSPNAGPVLGGTAVTIAGSGFTGTTAVIFGGVSASSITVISDTVISAITPGGIPGAANVAVTATGGTGTKTGGYTFVVPPIISTLSPASGTTLGGTVVTITGISLSGATAVIFGLTPAASFTVNSDTQITATAPAGPYGFAPVTVITAGGTSLLLPYQYILPPAIITVMPNMGPLAGGTTVTITGANFTGATSVKFGATPATSFTVDSDTQITAVAPAGAGTVQATVATAGGTSNGVSYTYVPTPACTSITPNLGPQTGGNTVTITGTGFSGAAAVSFGGTPAPSFTIVSDTEITAVIPAGTGAVQVTVTTAGGTSNGVVYTYVPAPVIFTIVPSAGPASGGTTVTITGTGYTSATSVNFGATPAISFTVDSNTQITAVTPAGTGTVSVTVMTAGGTSNGVAYTYVPAPVISTIVPNVGPESGGNTVTITGTGFTGATSVNFGVTPAAFTVNSDTQITAVVPAGAVAAQVTVTTDGGTSNGVTYIYAPVPVITAIVPNAGPATGGNTVTITGTGFTWAASVHFGAAPATSFMVISDTNITAIAPANDPVTVNVAVTTAGGTSNAAPYTYVPLPAISNITPNTGEDSGSTTVVITGTNLTGAMAVFFGAAPAQSYTVNSDTQITATAPAGTGTVNVCVTTAGGTSNAAAYTYIPAPVITSIAPTAGLESGGTTVTITGQHFTGVTAVYFGAVPALSFTVDSDTQITAVSPAGTAAGPVDVTVTKMYATATKTEAFTYVTQPNITSVSSDNGSLPGGNTVTIEGENLTWVNSVSFGGTAAASFTVNSDTSITVTVPARAEPGPVDITVSSYGFTSTLVSSYNYMALTISYVDSNMGPAEGSGNSVSIYGFCFTGAISVTFGGTPAVSFFVSEDRWIVAVPPAGTGTVAVTVTTPNGTATKAEAYTYVTTPTINSVSPNSGPMAGGNEVTITGTNLTETTSVSFGDIAATLFTVTSPTTITAIAPAHAAGIVDVVVTTAYGTATKAGAYTYILLPPTIISVSPSSGLEAGGTPVTITGTDFTGVTAVSFGTTTETSFTVNSSTSITVIAPAHAAGIVDVFVVAAGGVASGTYTYLPPPTITAVSPDEGSEAGGTPVTITGTGFDSVSSVKFDGTLSAFTVNSGTQITATVPAGAAGSADVMVTTPGGTATAVGAYTYIPAPSITSISPDEGPEPGGGTVTIAGTGFTGATAVAFGSTAATFSVDSDTQITATAPAGTAGLVDVKVTTPYGSDAKTDAYTYFPVPTITSVSSGEGSEAGGSSVTITGTGFYSVSSVKFGGTISAFTVDPDTDTQITAIVPARAAGQVDITVTTPGGTATAAGAYTYIPLPAITSVSPNEGPAAGGTPVIITGIGFVSVSSVKFGGAISAFTVDSDTQITATAPAGAAGPADVTVTTEYGTTTVAGAYTYIND